MNFKYWVEFDNDGEIKALYKDPKENCKEFIVKLIPIERDDRLEKSVRELGKGIDEFGKELKQATRDAVKASKLISEISKVASRIKKI